MRIHLFHLMPYGIIRAMCQVRAGSKLCRKHGAKLRKFIPASINGMTAAWNVSETLNDMKKPCTLLDAGANVSQVAKLLLLTCEKDAEVYSFEPLPDLSQIGKTFKVALSDEDGEADFYIPANDGELGSLHKEHAGNVDKQPETIRVKLARFDTMVKSGEIDWAKMKKPIFLKADVEGNELKTLKGFGEHLREIDYALLEIGQEAGRGKNYDFMDIAEYMREYGFDNSCVMFACYDGLNTPAYIDVLFWRSEAVKK